MSRVGLTVEGGLLAADLVERIAAGDPGVPGQQPKDFGIDAGRLSAEIQAAFSDIRSYWESFKRRREFSHASAVSLTREGWVIPLLERLSYTLQFQRAAAQIGGQSYPVSHRVGEAEGATPVHIVAWDQPPGQRAGGTRSPHALMQEYLNRSDALWGIVTNGSELRLLRNSVRSSRPSYVAVDLEAILDGNLYNEFALVFRLLHRSRLPAEGGDAHECLLERWYQQGIEEGGRVRDGLRDGVKAALEILGSGFLRHPANGALCARLDGAGLTEGQLYRELLSLIYRLLFLMVAEERRLLFVPAADAAARHEVYLRWYGVGRLRDRAERQAGEDAYGDLWEGLKETFRLFRDDHAAAGLALSALNGELFGTDACRDLEHRDATIRNDDLLDAMRQLSTFEERAGRKKVGVRRRVNYAGLDVEELGSIYESLLDYHPQVSHDHLGFALAAGSERKSTGSYYTPPELVRELIESALVPVMRERLAAAATREAKEKALLSLTICDPAAGSGHFLLAAARRVGRELAIIRSDEAEPAPETYRAALRDVIRHCIYAVDKNPLAVDLCKVALWIEGHAPGLPLSFLDHRIRCGDSLVGVFDLDVLKAGVPDAAFKPLTGDDKAVSTELRKRNKREREAPLGAFSAETVLADLAREFGALAEMPDETPDDVHSKAELFRELIKGASAVSRLRRACDAWTAAFFSSRGLGQVRAPPTTADVWNVLGGREDRHRAALIDGLSERFHFFHWRLAFPEVFERGGFDVMLGNPPWERIKLQEKEFFATRDREIAEAPNKAARQKKISALFSPDATAAQKVLGEAFHLAKRAADAESLLVRAGGRFSLTAVGDVNTYALFAETFLSLARVDGRAGLLVPTSVATDETTSGFFAALIEGQRLKSLIGFFEIRQWFLGTDDRKSFAALTIGPADNEPTSFAFEIKSIPDLLDERRRFTLTADDISLVNPNTHTCPIFRSKADAELTTRIYQRVPVLIDDSTGHSGNPWGIRFLAMFHMSNDSGSFRTARQLRAEGLRRDGADWSDGAADRRVPLYEAKMAHHYDHRWATYDEENVGDEDARRPSLVEKADPDFMVSPRYWVNARDMLARIAAVPKALAKAYADGDDRAILAALANWVEHGRGDEITQETFHESREALIKLGGDHFGMLPLDPVDWRDLGIKAECSFLPPLAAAELESLRGAPSLREGADLLMDSRSPEWLIGWRRNSRSGDERTLLAAAMPRVGVGDSIFLMLSEDQPRQSAVLVANLGALVLDFVARQKLGGSNFSYYYLEQLPILPPTAFNSDEMAFVEARAVELTYSSHDLRSFARDLGYESPPYRWDPERRALLRAELDAYFAYLYGLSRDELRYILDPKEVMGADYPSETFRVLKENEIKAHGEYRTRRLVLEAWDRFAEDGTFDPARLEDPTHFDVVRRALIETRGQVTSLEHERDELAALLKRSDATPLPSLFVEGESDVTILTAAWHAFHPGDRLPVTILAAGGTRQMASLAGKGAALRQVLGDRLVFALADNDREGRDLVEDGRTRRGGIWRQQTNGIHWCLLAPTEEFARAMKRFDIPEAFWPFTVENAFQPALRRQAMDEGAYAVEEAVIQSSFQADAGIANKALRAAHQLDSANDDAVLYFRPPAPEKKLAFAEWIAAPERRDRATLAAFGPILAGLRSVVSDRAPAADRPGKRGTLSASK